MRFSINALTGLVAGLCFISTPHAFAGIEPASACIQAVDGTAAYYQKDGNLHWERLRPQMELAAGATIKTGDDCSVDLVLRSSGTVLRLRPNSILRFETLTHQPAAEKEITESSLNLVAGSIVGSQRKLAVPSRFQVKAGGNVVTIVGTEYLVRADGAVTCLSGEISVNYNLPGNGGSVKVVVAAGYSFNPITGQVVPTTSAYLQNIIADINTVKQNAQVFKAGGATIVVKPEKPVSPVRGEPGGNGGGNEGGNQGGNGGNQGGDGGGQGGNHGNQGSGGGKER